MSKARCFGLTGAARFAAVVLFAVAVVPTAHAMVIYTIDFSLTSGNNTPTGSFFVPDADINPGSFTRFEPEGTATFFVTDGISTWTEDDAQIGNNNAIFFDVLGNATSLAGLWVEDTVAPDGSGYFLQVNADLTWMSWINPNTDISQGAYTLTLGQTTSEVPEPASLLLFGAGLAGLGLFRRRRMPA